ncbi:MAG TPA: hypothetical protein VEG60_30485 [Candidatus Binatia bacterium]|nr:hypothetical protein [Candidatus Binatia bacterium]
MSTGDQPEWLKEKLRKRCEKSWEREEKQFYIEVDGMKIFGHADGVPDLERYGHAATLAKEVISKLSLAHDSKSARTSAP